MVPVASVPDPAPHCCPLCLAEPARSFARAHGREYFECSTCRLVFLAPAQRPAAAAERAHYDTHENDPRDPRYRAFLDRLAIPLLARLKPGAEGLDYGSGPGPALAAMLAERGFRVHHYDPYFAPDPAPLRRTYDFITCTEVAEHFFRPGEEFQRLGALLRPGGWLGVMTQLLRPGTDFGQWRYARDPTHVCFYRHQTMTWIAARHGWSPEFPGPDVVLFRMPGGGVP